jgi:hypothetical protein
MQHQWWYRFGDGAQLVVLEPDGSRTGQYGSHWFVAAVNWVGEVASVILVERLVAEREGESA